MAEEETKEQINFQMPKNKTIIKVVGVGGGGGNAVSHMYNEGIHDVSFALCNTDNQALFDSPVLTKIQLGKEGLGAGSHPEVAREAAEESIDAIHNLLNDGTKMVFITAGMGGGTGTGAAPVVARVAKEMDILTVGIVTIPFRFEGDKKIDQALDGVEEMSKQVDALLVINNERLRDVYSDLSILNAFAKADDTLSNAARSIAEIITTHGSVNLDFNDVRMVLKDGGVAIISTGYGEGPERLKQAIENALHSPLLNNNDIYSSKKILISISQNPQEEGVIMMDEMNEVNDFMSRFTLDYENKWGLANDESLGKKVKVTILASGFGLRNLPGMEAKMQREEEKKFSQSTEETEHREGRREIYYGINGKNPSRHPRRQIFYFNSEDLDNDDIIAMLETTPTCKRSKEELQSIKAKSLHREAVETPSVPEDTSMLGMTPIIFK